MKKELKFSPSVKEQVREEQDGVCAHCQERRGRQKLEIHHRVPRSYIKELRRGMIDSWSLEQYKEYIQSRDNAIGVCPRCHRFLDLLALERRQYFGYDRPLGIPVDLERKKHERTQL